MLVCESLYVCVGVYILIAAGALMMVVGFLGCCGAIQESPCMLGMVCTIFFVLHLTNIKRKLFKSFLYYIRVYMFLSQSYSAAYGLVTELKQVWIVDRHWALQ